MKRVYRIIAFISALSMTLCTRNVRVYGAAPDVSTDEGVYVNLDYYGGISDVSVVKSSSLNGNNQFVDYGSYEKVMNMTNYAEPEIDDDKITWDFGQDVPDRFYYECIPKDKEIVLPWTFDVSYKLNGVPVKAEELAEAKGTVEINIKAEPNEDACDYYKNNMILQVAAMINMEDTLSIDAPGAQMQSLGTYKGVLFMGLPGEENEFTIRIGTNSFESEGIEMMMIPGTLDQLKKVKELKESKDKLQDSADDVNDSLDDILDTFNNMTSGLSELKSGLRKIDDSRKTISSSKGDIYDDADIALDNLDSLNENINTIVPHLKNCQNLVDDVNNDVNSLVDTSMEFKTDFTKFKNSITKVQRSCNRFRTMLKKLDSLSDEREELFDDFKDESDEIENELKDIDDSMDDVKEDIGKIKDKIDDVEDVLKKINDAVPQIDTSKAESALKKMKNKLDDIKSVAKNLQDISDSGRDVANSLKDAVDLFDDYLKAVENQSSNAEKLLKELNTIGDTTDQTLDKASSLLDKCSTLNDTLNSYKDDTIDMLTDSEELVTSTNTGIGSLSKLLRKSEDTIRSSGNSADEGSENTLNALDDLIDKSLDSIENTKSIRKAKNTIKNTIDDEVDKYEEDTNVLNMDYEHEVVSVTSDKNPSPSSIQIVLRTKEINEDSVKEDDSDLEKKEENIGLLNRLKAVISKMAQTVKALF